MDFIQLLATLLLTVQLANSHGVLYYREDEFDDSECPGQPNKIQPWMGSPTFVNQTVNGTLYTAGDGDDMLYRMCTSFEHNL